MIQDKRTPEKMPPNPSLIIDFIGLDCSIYVFCVTVWVHIDAYTYNTHPGKSNWQEIADFLT